MANELILQSIYWQKSAALATWVYATLVFITVIYAVVQVRELRKNRKLQTSFILFQELQAEKVRNARRYIYDHVPMSTEGVDETELKKHAVACEEAIQMFHRVGYLLREKQIDPDSILENYWDVVWRCWRRTASLIRWSRDQRNNPEHFFAFEHLYNMCEEYRKKNNYEEPKFC